MTKLVFATHNPNKLREIKMLLPEHIELLSLTEIGCTEEIPETSGTIVGNARQKAKYVTEKYNYPCFADDTGLEVAVLNGDPGVFSARYAGPQKNNEANIEKLLFNLKGTKNRKAQFKTVIALVLGREEILFTGICAGTITTKKKGKEGFGYDPIFQPQNSLKTFAEMTMEEKSKLSHRGKAVKKLLKFLQD